MSIETHPQIILGSALGANLNYENTVDLLVFEHGDDILGYSDIRMGLVTHFAWAIPNNEAIEALVNEAPLTEVGAGKGYWAHRIREAGGQIDAYDSGDWYGHREAWVPVRPIPDNFTVPAETTLFLCWPTYDNSWAHETLISHRGNTVAYVGEGEYGCTACPLFHEELDENWTLDRVVQIPTFPGINDRLEIWRRK